MTDVFVSYKREDRDKVATIIARLEEDKLDVFWDRSLRPGETWERVLAKKLNNSACVVVVWSSACVSGGEYKSNWVKAEVALAKERKVLLPVLLNDGHIPHDDRDLQFVDLTKWPGTSAEQQFSQLIATIQEHIAQTNHDEKEFIRLVARGTIRDEIWLSVAGNVCRALSDDADSTIGLVESLLDASWCTADLDEAASDANQLVGIVSGFAEIERRLETFLAQCEFAKLALQPPRPAVDFDSI